MNDFLSAEPLIIQRLKDKAGIANVFSTVDLQGVSEKSQLTPAVHVVYGGYIPVAKAGNPDVMRIEQSWMLIVTVRNVSATNEATAVNQEAGPHILNVIQALQGYRLSPDHSQLELKKPPAPLIRAGLGYYPILFTTKINTRGID